jgi:hypothetical protein
VSELALRPEDPVAQAVVQAIRAGSAPELEALLAQHPEVAGGRLVGGADGVWNGRTLLHVATDWPGHFPDVVAKIEALVAAGADVNATSVGGHQERPLHWAASSNDVAALDALLDAGADIDAPGAVIGGGPRSMTQSRSPSGRRRGGSLSAAPRSSCGMRRRSG